MKMVASARLRRAQTKAEATRPYAEKIGQILRHMSNSDLEGFESPLLDVATCRAHLLYSSRC